jgi:hypothetical protein
MLAELKMLLASDQLPVQEEVARAVGVHQSLVSRAQNGQLKRLTAKVETLLEYARSRIGAEQTAADAVEPINADQALPSVLSATADQPAIGTGTGRAARSRDDPAAEGYRRQARDGIETYLNDGYDPRLIVEQLVVLRRAQRLRRPGPLLSEAKDQRV